MEFILPTDLHNLAPKHSTFLTRCLLLVYTFTCCQVASKFIQFTHASRQFRQADLLYVQAGDVQVYDASFQAVHQAAAVVVGQQIPHNGCGQVTKAVGHNVGLQRLQEDALSHRVLHQARVELLKQQVPAGGERGRFTVASLLHCR